MDTLLAVVSGPGDACVSAEWQARPTSILLVLVASRTAGAGRPGIDILPRLPMARQIGGSELEIVVVSRHG